MPSSLPVVAEAHGAAVIVPLPELAARLRPGQRLLGLDLGTRTIGLALSDVTRTVASPLTTLRRQRFHQDAKLLAGLIAEHEVGGLVIGLPIEMDGGEGRRAQSVRQFASNLGAAIDLPMAFWDERFSTRVVERMLIEDADMSRQRRRQVIDRAAAAYILQGALDRMAASQRSAIGPTSPAS
jgi:putative Holliday junction resolvase